MRQIQTKTNSKYNLTTKLVEEELTGKELIEMVKKNPNLLSCLSQEAIAKMNIYNSSYEFEGNPNDRISNNYVNTEVNALRNEMEEK